MSIFPRKPKHGDKVLQSIYDAVCQIIDYLPSLQVRGDNRTVRVNSFSYGKTIESINTQTTQTGNSQGTSSVIMVEIINDSIPILCKKVGADGSLGNESFVLHTGTVAAKPGGLNGRVVVYETDLAVVGGSD